MLLGSMLLTEVEKDGRTFALTCGNEVGLKPSSRCPDLLQKVQATMMRQEHACKARQWPTSLCDFERFAWHTDSMEQRCMRRAMALLRQNQSRIPARTKLLTQPHITASLSKRNHRNSRTTSPCDFGRLTLRTCTGRTEGRCMRCDSAIALLRQSQSRIGARAKPTARPHLSNSL